MPRRRRNDVEKPRFEVEADERHDKDTSQADVPPILLRLETVE